MLANVAFSAASPSAEAPSQSGVQSKASSAAKEFESLLLGQWLQGAQTSFASVPGTDDDQENGDDQMRSYAIQKLARAITDAGGIGIATLLSKTLKKESQTTSISDPAQALNSMRSNKNLTSV